MHNLSEAKRDFRLNLIRNGLSTSDGLAPREAQWFAEAQQPLIINIDHPRRLVNHFKLGADPELVIVDPGGNQIRADALGLQTGRAFGADNNGRLVEIRPKPSRFILEIVVSLWSTMRWLNFYLERNFEVRDSKWYSNAYFNGDGLGGHIHFGRRREHRKIEVAALDNMWSRLSTLFSKRELMLRLKESNYGQDGDVRLQQHGYEYRSMASWLDSPKLAYLALTLAKLAVYAPELTNLMPKGQPHLLLERKNSLLHLLAYYKARDDDAAIAHRLVTERGWPMQTNAVIQENWNINYMVPPSVEPNYFPPSIPPSESEIKAFYTSLFDKGKATFAVPLTPNWIPTNLPKNYRCFATGTRGVLGIGEILNTLCYHQKIPVIVLSTDHDTLVVSAGLAAQLMRNWKSTISNRFRIDRIGIRSEMSLVIWLGPSLRTPEAIRKTKKLLTCGIFPIWSVEEVADGSFKQWKMKTARITISNTTRGEFLWNQ